MNSDDLKQEKSLEKNGLEAVMFFVKYPEDRNTVSAHSTNY